MKQLIFTALVFLLGLSFSKAEEPAIPGRIVAEASLINDDIFFVEWTVVPKKRPKPGSLISIEWGAGQYFATVIKVRPHRLVVDYYPPSVVPVDALIRLVHP